MSSRCFWRVGAALVLAAGVTNPFLAVADNLIFDFGDVYGGTAPGSNPPWMEAAFQTMAPGTVRLTLSNPGLIGSENADGVYFNLNPLLKPERLTFRVVGGSGGYDLPQISTGLDAFKAGPDGKYDIQLTFAVAGTDADRFGVGEYLVYDISGISTLTVADFEYRSASSGTSTPLYATAHVQRIGPTSASGWIDAPVVSSAPVPEPGSTSLWLLGLGLAAGWRRRSARSKAVGQA